MTESQSLNFYISLIMAHFTGRKINFAIVKRNLDKMTPNYGAVLAVYFLEELAK